MPIIGKDKMLNALMFGVKITPDELKFGSLDLTPEAAIARDLCPETGVALAELNIPDHILRLWPKDRSAEAVSRINLLTDWQTKHAKPAEPEAN